MDTKLFEDLLTLAETQSFQRAAELRCVTQPTLSRRIKSLEEWAGIQLVDRSTTPAKLTPAGQILRWKALDALQSLKATRASLHKKDSFRSE
jgi:DNA-binding transcriptional LysR family regulator